jgi:excisionase family DNA binding protein
MEKIRGKNKLKNMLVMTLRHIQQTNDLLNELIPIIESIEETAPVIVQTTGEYPDILSMDKAAEFTGYTKSYLYKLIHEGGLSRHGQGKIFFKKSELQDFMLQKKKSANYELSATADAILNGEVQK